MSSPPLGSQRASDGAPRLQIVGGQESGQPAGAASPRQRLARELDVRVRAELAHRRKIVAMARQVIRVVSLHGLDALAIALAVIVANQLAGGMGNGARTLIGLVGLSLISLNTQSAYKPGPERREAYRLALGMALTAVVVIAAGLLTGGALLPAPMLALFAVLSFMLLTAERAAVDVVVRRIYARGIGLRKAVVITEPKYLHEILRDLGDERNPDQHVIGYVTPEATAADESLGSLHELPEILDEIDVDEVIVGSPIGAESVERVTDVCFPRGIAVLLLPWGREYLHGWAEPVRIGRSVAYHLHPPRLRIPTIAVKRAMDLSAASVGLLLAAPVIAVIAVCIKLESRGPVFFKQRRVGLGGREFTMWKFRSMRAGSESEREEIAHLNQYPNRNLFKLKNDPRITRVGRVLRRFSLDELPQLVNILRGEMSLVGPRPPLPDEVKLYAPHHFVRLTVVPGLSGPWQVSGRNLISDFEEVVRLERAYTEDWTLALDAKILAKTVGVVLSGKGAY